jgi:hypothetical protein
MALSNIGKEPRREITESLLGIVLLVLFVGGDYVISDYFVSTLPKPKKGDLGLTMISIPLIGILIFMAVYGLALFTHFIGEQVCNALEKKGIHLRPRVRYRR